MFFEESLNNIINNKFEEYSSIRDISIGDELELEADNHMNVYITRMSEGYIIKQYLNPNNSVYEPIIKCSIEDGELNPYYIKTTSKNINNKENINKYIIKWTNNILNQQLY